MRVQLQSFGKVQLIGYLAHHLHSLRYALAYQPRRYSFQQEVRNVKNLCLKRVTELKVAVAKDLDLQVLVTATFTGTEHRFSFDPRMRSWRYLFANHPRCP